MATGSERSGALRGSVDLLVLKTLALQPIHGWGISQRIQDLSGGVLEMNQGSLYPALQRLEQLGWITAEWQMLEDVNRRAKIYSLTARGRSALKSEAESWRRYARAMELVLTTTSA